jgi:hypothetical protein
LLTNTAALMPDNHANFSSGRHVRERRHAAMLTLALRILAEGDGRSD